MKPNSKLIMSMLITILLFISLPIAATSPPVSNAIAKKIVKAWVKARAKLDEECELDMKRILDDTLMRLEIEPQDWQTWIKHKGIYTKEQELIFLPKFCTGVTSRNQYYSSLPETDSQPRFLVLHPVTEAILWILLFFGGGTLLLIAYHKFNPPKPLKATKSTSSTKPTDEPPP